MCEQNYNEKKVNQYHNICCPECGKSSIISIDDYKITLNKCDNGHNINNIFFDKFYEIQKEIDKKNKNKNKNKNEKKNKLFCDICFKNEFELFNNNFYRCLKCKMFLCSLCHSYHDKNHITINCQCSFHKDKFISYCNNCNKNLCILCEYEHNKTHNILKYEAINDNEFIDNFKDFSFKLKQLKIIVENMLDILNKVLNNFNIYYEISENIINNKSINYHLLKSKIEINKFNQIVIGDINKIIYEKDIGQKFNDLFEIYEKMSKSKDNKNEYPELNEDKQYYNINEVDNDDITVVKNNKVEYGDNKLKNNNNIIAVDFGDNKIKNNNINNENNNNSINEFEPAPSIDAPKNIFKNEITIQYKVLGNDLRIFGDNFVKTNRGKCFVQFKGDNRQLSTYFLFEKDRNKEFIEIKLFGINNLTDISYMFYNCVSLYSIPDISNFDTSKIRNMSYLFYNCKNLRDVSGISNWRTNKVGNISFMFCKCENLVNFPDISKWNTINVSKMASIFLDCIHLEKLPDISNWNTKNVTTFYGLFQNCKSLKYLPDISKWNVGNAQNFSNMFYGCNSLISLPDISKWNLINATNLNYMFYDCKTLNSLPNISRWNINKVTEMNNIFTNCRQMKEISLFINKQKIINNIPIKNNYNNEWTYI